MDLNGKEGFNIKENSNDSGIKDGELNEMHDIRVLNRVVKSFARQKDEQQSDVSDSVTEQGCDLRSRDMDASWNDSLASEDLLMLQDVLRQDSTLAGRVVVNFWPHTLEPQPPSATLSTSPPPTPPVVLSAAPQPPPPPEVRVTGPPSDLLPPSVLPSLAAKLPFRLQTSTWRLLYSVLAHGADILSFYKRTKDAAHTLVAVQTTLGEVFGGFAAEPWRNCTDYYGSGESFVFSVSAEGDGAGAEGGEGVEVFPWSFENSFFMWSTHQQIAMGGGDDGFAFVLDEDFFSGSSRRSGTFQNKPFSTADTFEIVNLEVWGFDSNIF